MKLKKLMLPMMAFVCAIGMAFGPANFSVNPENDYIEIDNEPVEIDELGCGEGETQCLVRLEEGGPVYEVFDDEDLQAPKMGSGGVIELF